jgi:hypothetical protein
MIQIRFREDTHTCTNCKNQVHGASFTIVIGDVVLTLCRPCTMLYDIRMRHAKRGVPLKIGGKDA